MFKEYQVAKKKIGMGAQSENTERRIDPKMETFILNEMISQRT